MTIKINAITEKENTNENIGLLLNKLLDGRMYEIYTITCALKSAAEEVGTNFAFTWNKKFYATYDGRRVKIGGNKTSIVFKYNDPKDIIKLKVGKHLDFINIEKGFHIYGEQDLTDIFYKEESWLDDFVK